MSKKTLLGLASLLLLISILSGGYTYMKNQMTMAIKYPTQPITLIVPFSAGGGLDLVARALEKVAPKHLGQSIIVVNKLGGGGTIGWNELSNATPDGYTIGITSPELLTLPLYGGTSKYNYPTALEPLAQISATPMVLVVHSEESWGNLNELVTYGKQHPGSLKFGHGGIGSFSHMIGESFAKSAHMTLEQVPFRGGSEVAIALLGKHLELAIVAPATVKEHIKNGTLKALAISGRHRMADPELAQIPTFAEQGFDVVFNNWQVIAAPKDLPPNIKAQLVAGLKEMIFDPEFKKTMDLLGVEVEYVDEKDTAVKWISEREKITKLLKETGILDLIKSQKK